MSSSAAPPVAPPSYDSSAAPKKAYGAVNNHADVSAPLLGAQAGSSSHWQGGQQDDYEDDFDIGVTVSQSSAEVRNAFVRKVYAVSAQIL
jgi:hypothetical protein